MPILYSVISRGITVLAKYETCSGNFDEITEQIISKIPADKNRFSRVTYSHGNYLLNYVCENGIIYMCISDNEFGRPRALRFIDEIQRRFKAAYEENSIENAIAYAMNSEFAPVLAIEMKLYSEFDDADTISEVHSVQRNIDDLKNIHSELLPILGDEMGESPDDVIFRARLDELFEKVFERAGISRVHRELDELKNILRKNIDNAVVRGERLEQLVNIIENTSLNSTSESARLLGTSRNQSRLIVWKNIMLFIITGALIIVALYMITTMVCGGFAWQNCVAKK